jgi:succinoglycan biosynthesis transport protein ExoP
MAENRPPAPPARPASEFGVKEFLKTLRQSRWLIAGITAVTVALVALYTRAQRPVFESSVSLQLEEEKGGLNLLSELGPLAGGGKNAIETDMLVLQSRRIAEETVDSLGLHVQLLEPERPRADVLQVLSAPQTRTSALLELRRRGDGAYDAEVKKGDGRVSAGVVRPGQRFELGGVTLALAPRIPGSPERIRISLVPYRDAVAALMDQMTVTRPNRMAQVVRVTFRGTDPVLAADVPNTAAASFLGYKSRVGKTETSSTVAFLRQQVTAYEGDLRTAESTLQAYREQAQIVSPREQAEGQVRQMAEVQAEREGLAAERQALSETLARVNAAARTDRAPGAESPYRQLASFPVFFANPAVQNMLRTITDLEGRRADQLVLRTEENADVRSLNTRIADIEQQLYRTAQSYLTSLDSKIQALSATLARSGAEMSAVPAREVQFARLARNQALLEEIYTLLQKRLKEAEIEEAVQFGDARVIDRALVPERPVAPNPVLNVALALIVGLMFGTGAAVMRRTLDNKVRTREDAVEVTGGMPVLATIPRIRSSAQKAAAAAGKNGKGKVVRVPPEQLIEQRLIVQREPHSAVAEAYRTLRTNIAFTSFDSAPRVLVVTSAMPGDGKSTSSSNLAFTLAQQGGRTLLVDGDLRRGLLHRLFDLQQAPGLTNVLVGQMTLDACVQRVPLTGASGTLDVLSAGVFPPNPADLLGSPRMRALMEEMRTKYDAVVIDAPPVGLVTDAAVMGSAADATILVARAGITEKDALHSAATQLHHVRARVGGVILNDFRSSSSGYGYYHDMAHAAHGANGNGDGTH